MTTLRDRLLEMSGKPPVERGVFYCVYLSALGGWVSGVPYDASQFAERAYEFGSREDAELIAREYFGDKQTEIIRRVHSSRMTTA